MLVLYTNVKDKIHFHLQGFYSWAYCYAHWSCNMFSHEICQAFIYILFNASVVIQSLFYTVLKRSYRNVHFVQVHLGFSDVTDCYQWC